MKSLFNKKKDKDVAGLVFIQSNSAHSRGAYALLSVHVPTDDDCLEDL